MLGCARGSMELSARVANRQPRKPPTMCAGPLFYISVQNNTELHGPGSQTHMRPQAKILDEADPCFARLLSAQDEALVRKLQALPTRKEMGMPPFTRPSDQAGRTTFRRPVEIVSMRLRGSRP